ASRALRLEAALLEVPLLPAERDLAALALRRDLDERAEARKVRECRDDFGREKVYVGSSHRRARGPPWNRGALVAHVLAILASHTLAKRLRQRSYLSELAEDVRLCIRITSAILSNHQRGMR